MKRKPDPLPDYERAALELYGVVERLPDSAAAVFGKCECTGKDL